MFTFLVGINIYLINIDALPIVLYIPLFYIHIVNIHTLWSFATLPIIVYLFKVNSHPNTAELIDLAAL